MQNAYEEKQMLVNDLSLKPLSTFTDSELASFIDALVWLQGGETDEERYAKLGARMARATTEARKRSDWGL